MEQKKTIKKAVSFFLPLIIIALITEGILRKIPNDYTHKVDKLEENAKDVEILILGASQTLYGLDPQYLDSKAFNMAYVSQSILFDNLVFKKFYKKLPKLEKVILPIAYSSLGHSFNESEEKWRKYNYYRYYSIDPPDKWYHRQYFELINLPLQNNVQKLYQYFTGKSIITVDDNGWCYNYTGEANEHGDIEENAKIAYERHENYSTDFCYNIELINEIIEICEKEDIEVVVLLCPVWESYEKLLNDYKFNKIEKTCNMFHELNSNVQFYNYYSDDRFNLSDFFDVDHLNTKGAIKFSKIINSEVLNQSHMEE